MVNDAETHVIAEPSVKSEYCEDGGRYISNLHSSHRILEPSQILDTVSDEVKRRSFSTVADNCRTASLETRRHASCNNELATLSFGGLIEAACSSDDVFCSSDSKSNLYSNGSASSMSPLSSADRDSSVGEGNLSRLLYNMCLSPTAAGRPIRGSQSSYSSLGGGLQELGSPTLEQAIMMGCRGYTRNVGGSCQQSGVEELVKPVMTAVGRAPGDRSPDALAELLNSLNCQQHKQQLHGSLAPQQVTAAGGSQQLGLPPSLIGARRAQFPLPRSQLSVATPSLAHRRGFIGDDLLEHSSSGGHLPYYDLPAKYGAASAAGRRSIEEAAKRHRAAAATNQATCTWSGLVPARPHRDAVYSCKVFLGGVPWDITESALASAFRQYGTIRVEWPGRDPAGAPVKGYVYVLFESERQVASMLNTCIFDASGNGNRYFKISSRRMRAKEVQVIPWAIADSNYVHCPSQQLDAQLTVFVGALHGMLTAETLARVLNDLFGGVLYAGIDTDKHKYPIGSGRVTFNNRRSFMWAVGAAFVEIKTNKFSKKVQIDPYLEDSLCSTCGVQQGPYFCRDLSCFRYFCRVCWNWRHTETLSSHKPLMRNSRSSSSPGRN